MIDDEAFMKVDNEPIAALMQKLKAVQLRSDDSSSPRFRKASSAGTDRVEFSITRDIDYFKKMLDALPDVSGMKIEELKPVVAADEYAVDPSLVARKMLDSSW